MCLIKIKNDVFNIVDRLKEIDSHYYVVYNSDKQRLEVHFDGQYPNSLACIVPFNCLDVRTLEHVNKTRRENIDKVIKEMDEHNKRLEKEADSLAIKNALDKIL